MRQQNTWQDGYNLWYDKNLVTAPVEVRHFQRFWTWTTFVVHMSPSTSRLFFFDHCGPSLRTTRKNASIREHQVTWWRCYNVSETSCKLLDQDVTTYQEHVGSNLKNVLQRIMRIFNRYMTKKMQVPKRRTWKNFKTLLQRIRTVLQVSWRKCYNSSRTSCKLSDEDVTTYHERLARYLNNLLQRIKNVFKVTWWRWYNISGTSCELFGKHVTTYQERLANNLKNMLPRIKRIPKKYVKHITTYQKIVLEKPLQRFKNVVQVAWRRCYNVSSTSFKLLDEDVTTCQERLATYWEKLLQCIRNVLKGLRWRCYNLSGTSCKLPDENDTLYQECLLSCK